MGNSKIPNTNNKHGMDTGNQTCTMQALFSRGQMHSQVLQIQTLGLQKYYCCIVDGDKCKLQQNINVEEGPLLGMTLNIIVAPEEKMMV